MAMNGVSFTTACLFGQVNLKEEPLSILLIHLPCTLGTNQTFPLQLLCLCTPPQYTHTHPHIHTHKHLHTCQEGCETSSSPHISQTAVAVTITELIPLPPVFSFPPTGFLTSLVGIQLKFIFTFKMVLPKGSFILFLFFSCLFCPFMVPDLLSPRLSLFHSQGPNSELRALVFRVTVKSLSSRGDTKMLGFH